ncbi:MULTISPECIES: Na/Pi cotransporter family protein [Jonquetella]|uniref:Na/Pi-cotransporter n=1 Tax=Jonquetella anthropi DSM 22815 TaxID=885272 RepID=H0UJ02_9BACT|nr:MULTISPECIES: Na/Pi cotransporter family protein [Jonquetella]EEX49037.1 Na/Pi-cotransporter II-like protein [Jonquetella anthropi E3_33 E1]EHM13829.1 Na/Pi-cotransporter [Jonquetella anthropi DSM 22815]ERL23768.1 Na/Pi-cotransporter II-like protein [Jonquetella sp. BV3C21]
MTIDIAFKLLGGIGLFLYGMKLLSDALQDLAGDRMRQLIAALTSRPWRGVLVGTVVTMIIQSSSATTVMVVSFVQAGLMQLRQALAVCMGANVGTTVTAQLIAFNISDLALPCIGVGMLLALFGRSKRQRFIGNGIFGFGLLFLGMNIMSDSMAFMRDRKEFFLAFSDHPLMGVLAGTVLTMIVQSSSATVGLTMAIASQGFLPLSAAIPILLGDNLGTTITAVLASLAASREAKQAALGHVLNKLIGVLIVLPFLPAAEHLIGLTSHSIGRQIANAHTLFNLANTVILFPFITPLTRFIQKVLPAEPRLVYSGPQFLDNRLLESSPAAAVAATKQELLRMGRFALSMLDDSRSALLERQKDAAERVAQTEKIVNELNRAVAEYAAKLWHTHLASELSSLLASYVNGAGDVERIGDHCTNLIEMYEYVEENKVSFSPMGYQELAGMFDLVRRAVSFCLDAFDRDDMAMSNEVAGPLEDEIDQMEQNLRATHIARLNEGACSPAAGIAFVDVLSNLERIGDHAHNVSLIVRDEMRASGKIKSEE